MLNDDTIREIIRIKDINKTTYNTVFAETFTSKLVNVLLNPSNSAPPPKLPGEFFPIPQ